MGVKIEFPEPIQVPRELPLYAAIPPAWNSEKVAKLAARFDLRGDVADVGSWFVCRSDKWTLEVYQATQSLRLERNDFDAEGRGKNAGVPDRDRAVVAAKRFLDTVGDTFARAEVDSVTELQVIKASRENQSGERQVVGLQVNYRYSLDGLPLVGPGAKAQVTVGHDGELAQAYRFAREVKKVGARPSVSPGEAFKRFAASDHFANLTGDAKVTVTSAQLGLLCLAPTEVQGVLVPAYVLRGEVNTELLPRYQFITYVAAADLDEADAKRQRWQHVRPALLAA